MKVWILIVLALSVDQSEFLPLNFHSISSTPYRSKVDSRRSSSKSLTAYDLIIKIQPIRKRSKSSCVKFFDAAVRARNVSETNLKNPHTISNLGLIRRINILHINIIYDLC